MGLDWGERGRRRTAIGGASTAGKVEERRCGADGMTKWARAGGTLNDWAGLVRRRQGRGSSSCIHSSPCGLNLVHARRVLVFMCHLIIPPGGRWGASGWTPASAPATRHSLGSYQQILLQLPSDHLTPLPEAFQSFPSFPEKKPKSLHA